MQGGLRKNEKVRVDDKGEWKEAEECKGGMKRG